MRTQCFSQVHVTHVKLADTSAQDQVLSTVTPSHSHAPREENSRRLEEEELLVVTRLKLLNKKCCNMNGMNSNDSIMH